MGWTITTPLIEGPLGSDSYTLPITGLAPSTNYIYRAYFIVDGIEYYGNILSGTTAAISLSLPTVVTGSADLPTTDSFEVRYNCVSSNGGASIVEYGILYTPSSVDGSIAQLIFSNTDVCKASNLADININTFFSQYAFPLPDNTKIYYRAFAKNAVGVGYGSVKTKITECLPQGDNQILLTSGLLLSDGDNRVSACAKLTIYPSLNPHQTIMLNINNCARSRTDIPMKTFWACSYYVCNGTCINIVNTNIGDATIGNKECYCNNNTLTIDSTTDLTFYTVVGSHPSNSGSDYLNEAVVRLSTIVGGDYGYKICDDNNRYLRVASATSNTNCEISYNLPSTIK